MRDAVIFDMDGTLANVDSIRHFVDGDVRDFHSFHMASIDCPPNHDVVQMAYDYRAAGNAILIVTAREAIWYYTTFFWIIENSIPFDEIYMRNRKDYRSDYDVKSDILKLIQRRYNVIHAVDDNPAVIQLWSENNIPTTIIPGWDGKY